MRKFAGSVFCAALTLSSAACSSNDDPAGPGAGGTNGASGAGTSGSANTAAGTSNAGSGSVLPADPTQIVGTFTVQMKVDKGMTNVVGQVADGPVPVQTVLTETKKDGSCRVETPSSPFCDGGCGAEVCVASGKCQPYPTGHPVGAVTLKGVHVAGGGSELTLKETVASYQPPAGTKLAYPSFGVSDTIEVHATGQDYAGFDLSAPGVDPIALKTEDFALDPTKPFQLDWDPAADPKSSQVHVKIDLSHHGGLKGLIECDLDDTGSLTISQELISELIGLGVAGYPSVVLTRSTEDIAQLDHGRVRLEVSALVERYLTTPGVESCTTNEDCAEGKTCRSSDSTCQ